ncbi:hypothetical protein [Moraxella porci]|uniref:hypothetical protein n=1 Tax=Moraxella porci TaxID=1288392 RepID=UPI00244BACCA|nr:hypothetical protein [Moraxella porci]MDH2274066.1 hypothetical protein [Moraxella porci]
MAHPLKLTARAAFTPWMDDIWDRHTFDKQDANYYWHGYRDVCTGTYQLHAPLSASVALPSAIVRLGLDYGLVQVFITLSPTNELILIDRLVIS